MKKLFATIGLLGISLFLPLSAFAITTNRICDANADMTLDLVQGTTYSYPTDYIFSPFGTAFIYGSVDGIDFPWEDSNHRGIVGTPTVAGTYDLHINCNPGYVAFTVTVSPAAPPPTPPPTPTPTTTPTSTPPSSSPSDPPAPGSSIQVFDPNKVMNGQLYSGMADYTSNTFMGYLPVLYILAGVLIGALVVKVLKDSTVSATKTITKK